MIDMIICVVYTLFMWHFRPEVLDLRTWDLSLLEIRLVHNLGLMFVMNNVIPKYFRFTGARRHRNDMGMKKTYLTKNYFRLALHILGGSGVFFFGGFYLQSEAFFQKYLSLTTLKIIFIAFDFLHQATIWLMLRNHDGMFLLRSNNLSLAMQKVAMDIQLWEAATFEDARPIIAGLFLATAGFALTRFWCFIVAMAQVIFGRSFDSMRENWYSVGEWLAQLIIMVRTGVCRENNICYMLSVYWFPHELWNNEKDDHQDIAKYVAYVPAALYFYGFHADVTQRPLLTQTSDLVCQLALAVHSMYYCGKYFKREPLPGVDYKSARKSFGSLIDRTILQARKSIFMYGNKKAAKDMHPSQVRRLTQELNADVPVTPGFRVANDSPVLHQPAKTVSVTLPEEVISAGAPMTNLKSAMRNPSKKRIITQIGQTTSVVSFADSPSKRSPNGLPDPVFSPPDATSVSSGAVSVTTSPTVVPTPPTDPKMTTPLHTGLSDISHVSDGSSWQDPDAIGLPRVPTDRLTAFTGMAKVDSVGI